MIMKTIAVLIGIIIIAGNFCFIRSVGIADQAYDEMPEM